MFLLDLGSIGPNQKAVTGQVPGKSETRRVEVAQVKQPEKKPDVDTAPGTKLYFITDNTPDIPADQRLLLKGVPEDTAKRILEGKPLETYNEDERDIANLLIGLNKLKAHFNNAVKNLDRTVVNPEGFYVPEGVKLTEVEIKAIQSGKPIPKELQEKIILNALTKDDITHPPKGKGRDWKHQMYQDGKTFKFTVLPRTDLSGQGFPIGFITNKGQTIDPKSAKTIYYKDPESGEIRKGVYFEVNEPAGPKGPGGINGIIVPAKEALVIIDSDKKKAYFINAEESRKNLLPELPGFLGQEIGVG